MTSSSVQPIAGSHQLDRNRCDAFRRRVKQEESVPRPSKQPTSQRLGVLLRQDQQGWISWLGRHLQGQEYEPRNGEEYWHRLHRQRLSLWYR